MPDVLTTANGNPVDNDQTSQTAGEWGPVLLQDFHLIDKLAHFDRERIPERVVHAKGAGAHGYFEVMHDITHLSKAKFLNKVGKKTPIFTRFSQVGGEMGSADTLRDVRGFAVKFYTEEGNWDMVGIHTPSFFIRDPSKFPDLIHTQKRNPRTNLKDADMFWDFLSLVPESIHQVTTLYSNRGTPYGYRHMHGYSTHTLSLINDKNEIHYVKFHFKTAQGIKNLRGHEATKLAGDNPDSAVEDLFNAIEKGDYPAWDVSIQVMEQKDAKTYRWNPFDMTKIWPHEDYPLQPIGRMVLNRNPDNFFAETEQSAFSPSHLVPGVDASPDRMLQGRLFSYPDTHRYRLGVNYQQLAINRPISGVHNYQRDGAMTVNGNQGKGPNYGPNSFDGPQQTNAYGTTYVNVALHGDTGRFPFTLTEDDFVQAGDLYRLLPPDEKSDLVDNIAEHLSMAKKEIRDRQIPHFSRADKEYGQRVADAINKRLSQS